MTDKTRSDAEKTVQIERTYEAPVEDVWALWATKEGFESWWGPKGFRVEVHALDLRVGGELNYDMIADGEAEIAYMKAAGMPLSHGTRGTFVEVVPLKRLKILHTIDFIPGLEPYDNSMAVDLIPAGGSVRMVVTLDKHPDETWTRQSVEGFTSQLTKVPAALKARATRRR